MTPKTSKFHSISDTITHCGLDTEECSAFFESMCEGEAAYGTNAHSLVTGQYICATLLDELNEEWSGRLLDKLQRFMLDCDDKDILFDLEG